MSGPPPDASSSPAPAGEFGRIDRYFRPLTAGFAPALDLADDAALVDVPAGQQLVVTTDAMVAGIHFLPTDPPADIAAKLVRVNLSDLAAKGARPYAYSLAVELPRDLPEAWLAAFTGGLRDEQERWDFRLLGGDSVATTGPVGLTLSALGLVPAGGMVRRSGARPGDHVYVTGTVGDGAFGLMIVLDRLRHPLSVEDRAFLVGRLRRPEPRLALIEVLRRHATAALDISDGLVSDLGHLARASGVALEIRSADIPLSAAGRRLVERQPDLMSHALTGGDDYEIAFTAPAASHEALVCQARKAGVPVACIGHVEAGDPAVRVRDPAGTVQPFERSGWSHF